MRNGVELDRLAAEARLMAEQARQQPGTAHLLLALFVVPTPAELVLRARRVDEEAVLSRLATAPSEPPDRWTTLVDRARRTAADTGSPDARGLHLLLAICRQRDCQAHQLLTALVGSTSELATEVMRCLTGPLPRRFVPAASALEVTRQESPAARVYATAPPPTRAASMPSASSSSMPPSMQASASIAAASNPSTPSTGTAHPTVPAMPRTSVPPPRPGRIATLAPPVEQRSNRLSKVQRLAAGLEPEPPESPFTLRVDQFPYLVSLGRNLTELAAAGRIDPVIGREREIDEVLDVLGRRRSNNPVLVGEPGVGKTAVVEGVACELVAQAARGRPARILLELDVAGLLAGTALRGALSEKLNGLKDEMRRADGRVVVFIDEIHMLVGAGQTGEGAQDASNELKAALARGEFPCVGATTFAEFQRYFAQDPALERRFVPIRIDEPDHDAAVAIVRGVADRYAQHHGVSYDDAALVDAVRLSSRYIRDRALPDKAVAVLDFAGSRAARSGEPRVTRTEVARAVARMARVPDERVLLSDAERLLGLEQRLSARVVGHAEVVQRVARVVRRNDAGFSGRRPLATFLFLGPTGVGKTELARALADELFGGTDALIRVDMSEFAESHAVAKLVGAPPGYVGFGEGGQLTEAVRRRPACVVLLDEIEKAHRDSQQLVLQLLDEGHLTDGRGRRVDFSQAVVVLTSNLGAAQLSGRGGRQVGFGSCEAAGGDGDIRSQRADRALAAAQEAFPPELWNRVEERLPFHPLERADLARVAQLLAADSSARLAADKSIQFELDDAAVDYLLDNGGHDPQLGARPLRQALSRHVEGPLAERILREEVRPGDRLRITRRNGQLAFDQLTVIVPRLARRVSP